MKAVVCIEPNRYEFRTDIPIPEIGKGEVLCKVSSVAICGTDLGIISGKFYPMWPPEWPFIIGHEWSGIVEKIGLGVTGFKVGDRVAGSSAVGCSQCRNCMIGRYNLCLNYGNKDSGHRQYGMTAQGAYAEYINVNARSLVKIPKEINFEEAALLDTAGIALHIAKRGEISAGDTVVVIGPGAVGSIVYQCARALGAGSVIVIGRDHRLQKAKELGYEVINYQKYNPVDAIKIGTEGIGPDVVLECAGTVVAIRQAIEMIKKGGRVVIGGIPSEEANLPLNRFVLDEIDVVGSRAAPNALPEVLSLYNSGVLQLNTLITHKFNMSDFSEAIKTFEEKLDGALKVIVEP